jgi:hypothetical protein
LSNRTQEAIIMPTSMEILFVFVTLVSVSVVLAGLLSKR